MDRLAKLVALLAAFGFAAPAFAGYAQLKPPPGWTPGAYAPAANDAVFGPIIHSPAGPVGAAGGQAVRMPAAYRLAANAPRIAAAIVFSHPYIRTGLAIASWLAAAKLIWDGVKWVTEQDGVHQSTGLEYSVGNLGWQATAEGACKARVAYLQGARPGDQIAYQSVTDGQCVFTLNGQQVVEAINSRGNNCPVGWYVTPAGCVQTPPPVDVNKDDFVDKLGNTPMPERVPLELPQPSPLPIEQPSPWINPLPGPNPAHRPMRVPVGDPLPVPETNPQQWRQPYVDIVPSPTPEQPWRVDMRPGERLTTDLSPLPDPGSNQQPGPGQDKPTDPEKQDLCEKHPDILACAKLGDAGKPTPVPNSEKAMEITPDSGWGPSGSCPAPKTVQVHGFTLSMPFDLLCDFANGIRPVVIGLAWLAAAFTFMGLGRRGD